VGVPADAQAGAVTTWMLYPVQGSEHMDDESAAVVCCRLCWYSRVSRRHVAAAAAAAGATLLLLMMRTHPCTDHQHLQRPQWFKDFPWPWPSPSGRWWRGRRPCRVGDGQTDMQDQYDVTAACACRGIFGVGRCGQVYPSTAPQQRRQYCESAGSAASRQLAQAAQLAATSTAGSQQLQLPLPASCDGCCPCLPCGVCRTPGPIGVLTHDSC